LFFQEAKKSIELVLLHKLAIYCLKKMLIIEGFQISNHDILALSEELFINANESQFINKL